MVSVPLKSPTLGDENCSVMVQDEPLPRVAGQSWVDRNGALAEMDEIRRNVVALLDNTTVCVRVGEASVYAPTSMREGRSAWPCVTSWPLSAAETGGTRQSEATLAAASPPPLGTSSVPEAGPCCVGTNATSALQEAPAPIEGPQSVRCKMKSPVVATGPMNTVPMPGLAMENVSDAPCLPTSTLPKSHDEGVIVSGGGGTAFPCSGM